MTARRQHLGLLALLLLGAGCTEHISPYRAKHRDFDTGDYDVAMRASPGSLFSGRSRGLFENDRARNVGDVVEILVDEADSGSHDANSQLKTSNSASIDNSGLLDLIKKAAPSIDLKSLLGLASQSNFQGQGQIQKNGKLTAHLSVRVRKVLPNGDLYAEGTKVVMVGAEEHHVYISGVIRPQDVALDGTVSSGRVADAEIEFTGRGDINDTQRPGWLSRLFKKLWPF